MSFELPFGKATLGSYELILTENCNFRCKYCFDDSFSDRTSCNYDYVMSLEKIPDIIDFIEKTREPGRRPSVSFFGGEPTMNWAFIQGFIKAAEERKLDYHWSMNTNVSLLTPERVDYLVSKRFNLVMSIDGIQKAHDSTRVYKGGKGTWLSIMKVLPNVAAKFRTTRLAITAMMVVDSNNFRYLADSYKFLLSLGLTDVNILWNFECGYSEDDYQFIRDQLTQLFKVEQVRPYLDLKRRIWNQEFQDIARHPHYCQSVEHNVTINPKGQLFFCHRLTPKMSQLIEQDDYPESFGNIYDGYINKDYLQFIHDRIDINISRKEECLNCPALPFCKGGCIGAIRDNTDGYDHLESHCRLEKLLAEVFYGI